jgi:energy-coupling factor transport system ATP-binding protein
MLEVANLTYTYAGERTPALKDISFRVEAGECVCFTGHSGCGKTTLLLALKDLLHEGILNGSVTFGKGTTGRGEVLSLAGLVFQNAESQLLCATAFDEVAFGPENLLLPSAEINERIVQALTSVDLLDLGNRNVEHFSAGQKQRLCIAAVLSMQPRVLLLDEPTSQLDRKGRSDLLAVLRPLKKQGISILIAEHNIAPFMEIIDRYYLMSGGSITGISDQAPEQYPRDIPAISSRRRSAASAKDPVVKAEAVSVSYPGSGTILTDVTFDVAQGELVHLYGENGCGKSTLLKTLAGAIRPDAGSLRVANRNYPRAGGLMGAVALLFQNPQRQLFEDTVFEEVAFTLRRLELPDDEITRRVESALSACEATLLRDRLPLTLSFGEQHRVALASVIAPDPRLILLDEPFAGLDPTQRLRLLKILSSLREERGASIVIASHDPLPDPEWADRTVVMENGKIADGEACAQ